MSEWNGNEAFIAAQYVMFCNPLNVRWLEGTASVAAVNTIKKLFLNFYKKSFSWLCASVFVRGLGDFWAFHSMNAAFCPYLRICN